MIQIIEHAFRKKKRLKYMYALMYKMFKTIKCVPFII